MIRHNEPGISVRISDEGLRRLANDNALLRACDLNERAIYAIGLPICIAICVLVAHAAVTVD
ncbi:hypothetical protein C7410_14750 [Paraburkholderia silvatlantica]|uniref:Uncharacterized protein n=1 Tax=Paraburkholderia silvatlantica TaxID=321895 RepID=A0A2V4TI01_9BURK|nr:hypothetical protein [Paraburkholderia silvatlantica]PYE13395.1 hypothetical protein C7410_14750 [Paraburkholderia silvatlantica]